MKMLLPIGITTKVQKERKQKQKEVEQRDRRISKKGQRNEEEWKNDKIRK